tara:strand:- start:113 stop:361 length:249 start_codon:yes stop_codon:yes gene_type:complete
MQYFFSESAIFHFPKKKHIGIMPAQSSSLNSTTEKLRAGKGRFQFLEKQNESKSVIFHYNLLFYCLKSAYSTHATPQIIPQV